MFKDVQLSKDLMAQFKKMFDNDEAALDVTLDVNVCTTGYWSDKQTQTEHTAVGLDDTGAHCVCFFSCAP